MTNKILKRGGGPSGTRTPDQPVMSRLLWPTELMALTVGLNSSFFASFDIIAEQLYFVKGDFSKKLEKINIYFY